VEKEKINIKEMDESEKDKVIEVERRQLEKKERGAYEGELL
jgi:hypothetical protein